MGADCMLGMQDFVTELESGSGLRPDDLTAVDDGVPDYVTSNPVKTWVVQQCSGLLELWVSVLP